MALLIPQCFRRPWTVAVLTALLTVPAVARGQCRSEHSADIPIKMAQGLPLVSVIAGGHETTLIIDTGAELTMLSDAAAQRRGLRPHRAYPRTMSGLNGAVVAESADVSLTAGGVALSNFGVLVGSVSLPALAGTTPDGLLGADILSNFEADLDIPHGVLHLYRGDSCASVEPTWAQNYAAIAANRSLHNRLFFPVMVDGHRLAAIFDTGAQHSIIDQRSARAVGVDGEVLKRDPAATFHGITGPAAPTHVHRFGRLVVGDETLANPLLIVGKLDLEDANLILGMDYLRSHRVWLSYGSHRVFVARADAH